MNLRKVVFAATLAAFVSLSSLAVAQGSQCFAGGPWLPNPMEAHQLKSDVYWIEGSGGNSTVIIGDNTAHLQSHQSHNGNDRFPLTVVSTRAGG